MSAAAPTTDTTPLPATKADTQRRLSALKLDELRSVAALNHIESYGLLKKSELVNTLAEKHETLVWPTTSPALTVVPEPTAGTGDVDAQGDVIGQAPTDPYNCDDDGFPKESAAVAKLDQEHVEALVFWLESNLDVVAPEFVDADARVAWVVANGYDDEPAEGENTEPAAHIPIASPAPTTVTSEELARINAESNGDTTSPETCACAGKGGFETDAGWEKCTNCDGAVEDDGQLTLVPGGAKPDKSILNVASLRVDLGRTQFAKGDRVRVTFELDVDTVAFPPERQGKKTVRELRTHTGRVDLDSVDVSVA